MKTFEQAWAESGFAFNKNETSVGWHMCLNEVTRLNTDFDYFKVQKAALKMMNSGGGFMSQLGRTFTRADESNARKLYKAFQSDFDQFYEIAVADGE
jgi:hypothetical protein